MEIKMIFESEENINELKNIIERCLNGVQFLENFYRNDYEISIDYNGQNNYIRGYLKNEYEKKEIFHLRFEENEIKKLCIAYSIRRQGIGTTILNFIIEKYGDIATNEKIYVVPDGYSCSHDDFKNCVLDDGRDKDISQDQRIQFYRSLGFIKDFTSEEFRMYKIV